MNKYYKQTLNGLFEFDFNFIFLANLNDGPENSSSMMIYTSSSRTSITIWTWISSVKQLNINPCSHKPPKSVCPVLRASQYQWTSGNKVGVVVSRTGASWKYLSLIFYIARWRIFCSSDLLILIAAATALPILLVKLVVDAWPDWKIQ